MGCCNEDLDTTNETIKELDIKFRYFETRWDKCCCLTGLTIGFREKDNQIEYAIAIRNPKDIHCKKIARKHIVKRFLNNQTLTVPASLLINIAPLTKELYIRNSVIIQFFIAMYNARLIHGPTLGFHKLPYGELIY